MKKSPRIFEKISSLMSSFMAFYPFGLSKDEPGINISEAMATRFGLRAGNISEAELSDAVTVATGGVNGSTMRHADGILYRRPDGKYVMHRIVRVHKDSFDMCGDGQREIERNVPKSAVVAQAVGFVRKGRQFSVRSPKYRLYSWLWCSIIPLRGLAFKLNYKLRGRRK